MCLWTPNFCHKCIAPMQRGRGINLDDCYHPNESWINNFESEKLLQYRWLDAAFLLIYTDPGIKDA